MFLVSAPHAHDGRYTPLTTTQLCSCAYSGRVSPHNRGACTGKALISNCNMLRRSSKTATRYSNQNSKTDLKVGEDMGALFSEAGATFEVRTVRGGEVPLLVRGELCRLLHRTEGKA